MLAEQKAEEKIQNSITINEVYKIVNDTLKQNTKLLNGFIIPNISINKKIEISTRYNHSFYDGTTSNKNQTNQTKEQKEQIEKKEYAHIQIPNNVIRDFFNSGGEQKNSNGIKIDITIDRIYINTRGILNIIPSKIKEAGLSNREIKNRNLKKYIEQNYKDREKRELPKLITSIYAITSSNSNIDKDINEIAIIKDVVIQKAKTEKEIKSLALSKEAQSKDLIVFFRGGHEDENMEMFSTIETIDAIAQSAKPIVVALGHRDDRPFIEIFADKIFATPSEFAKAIADMLFNTINQKNNTITQIKKNLMSIISSEEQKNNNSKNTIENLHLYCISKEKQKVKNTSDKIETAYETIIINEQNRIQSTNNRISALFDTIMGQEQTNIKNRLHSIDNQTKSLKRQMIEKKEYLDKLAKQKKRSRNITIVIVVTITILFVVAFFLK